MITGIFANTDDALEAAYGKMVPVNLRATGERHYLGSAEQVGHPSVVNPSQEDAFVRGISEAVGGPLGEHAARVKVIDRMWTAPRIIIVLAILIFGLHWIQKSPCQDGAWANHEQYRNFCYTDVLALYFAEHLHEGAVPYFDWPVEYPVLTGFFMGALGLPVHDFATANPDINQAQAFYNLNALVLSAFGIAAIAAVLALRRRRPWDAAMFVLAPALLVTATVNWDLLAVGLTAFFLYAWAKRMPVLAGVLLGLAVSAKLYPLFLLGPLLVLALRTWRWRRFAITTGIAAITWLAVNLPVIIWAYDGWLRFWSLSSKRPIDWGTFWYIGAHLPVSPNSGGGIEPFTSLGSDIPLLNTISYLLFGLACVGVAVLALRAPIRPRLAQLGFIVIALFLLTSKVWSQQFVLWVIPLAVLARPRWGAFLAWQLAELGYFFAFYAQMLNISGQFTIPEGTYVLASFLRWVTLAVLVGFVVRDVLRPERDVVRRTYGDDPDGGDFTGAYDDGLVRLRRWYDRARDQYANVRARYSSPNSPPSD
jgi:uncharacterized membrane protein